MRKPDNLWRSVFESAGEAMLLLDSKHEILACNKKAEKLYGYSESEMIGMSFSDLCSPESRREPKLRLKRRMRAGGVVFASGHRRQSGAVFVAEVSAKVVEVGDDCRFVLIVRDHGLQGEVEERLRVAVEEMRVAEEESRRQNEDLAESHEETERQRRRYQELFDLAPGGYVITDANGNILEANRAAVSLLASEPGRLGGVQLTALLAREDQPGLSRALTGLREGAAAQELEAHVEVRGHPPVEVALKAVPVRNANDETTWLLCDLSNLKRSEAALQASEDKFRVLTETAPSAIFIYAGDRLRYTNRAAEELTGYSSDELHDITVWDLIHPDHRELVGERGRARLRGEAVSPRYEFKLITKAGDERWVDSAASLFEFEGEPAVLGTVFDITAQKRAEETLAARARQQAAVAELGQRALTGGDLQALMEYAVEAIADALNVEYCKILELLPGGQELLLRAGAGWKEGVVGLAKVGAGLDSQAGYTLFSSEPIVVEDLGTEMRFTGPPLLHGHGVVSGVSVIIAGRHGPFGVLGAHTKRRRSFTKDDVNFLQSAANVLAQAIERKRTEDALWESEQRLRLAVRASNTGLWDWNPKTNQVYFSPEWKSQLGYEEHEIKDCFEVWEELLHPDDRERMVATVNSYLAAPWPDYEVEFRLRHKDGSYRWILTRASLLTDGDGRPHRMLGLHLDITERKQAERALAESELRYRTLFELSPDGIVVFDPNMRITMINQKGAAILTHDHPDELIGKGAFDFLAPEDWPRAIEETRDVLAGRGRDRVVLTAVKKDGTRLKGEFGGAAITGSDGNPAGILGVFRDVSDRDHVEQALRLQAQILDQVHDSVISTDVDGFITSWNKGAERLFGFSAEEALGRHISILYPEGHQEFFERGVIAPLKAKGNHEVEVQAQKKSGEKLDVHLSLSLLHDGEGVAAGMIGYSVDITARKRAEASLRDYAERLRLLREIDQAVLELRSPAEIAQEALSRLRLLIPCKRASIALCDLDSSWSATLLAVDTEGGTTVGSGTRLSLDEFGISVLQQGRINPVDDLRSIDQPSPLRQVLKTEGLRSLVNVPLMVQGKLIGSLNLAADAPGPFPSEHLEIAREVADLVTIAIQNARLYEGEHRAREVAETLRAANMSLTQSLDIETVLETLLAALERFVPYDSASVMLREDANHFAVRAVRGYERWTDADMAQKIALDLREAPLLRTLVSDKRIVLVEDSHNEPQWLTVAGAEHVRNWMGVPLVSGGEVIGLYSVDKAEPGFFTAEHLQLAESLSAQAAAALQNGALFEQVKAGRERLESLSRQLMEAQETERRHLARELHDEIGQALTAVKLNLQALQQSLSARELKSRLDECIGIADRTLQQVRNLSIDLRPSMLDDIGLVSALRWYVDRFGQRSGINAQFSAARLARLPSEIETACFRVAQESLTNVVRHSRARQVGVELKRRDGELELGIRDDGIGFDAHEARARAARGESFGLLGMEERVALVGGRIEILSAPEKGTEIRASFPVGK
ncbi:MAG TPA: PAS domain S-box protein [Blastocatellia bacterium]|nr:PAS domain S-box protein [Blastocatellia bacterium]